MKDAFRILLALILLVLPVHETLGGHHHAPIEALPDHDHGHRHAQNSLPEDTQDSSGDRFHQFLHDHSHPTNISPIVMLPAQTPDAKPSFRAPNISFVSRTLAPNPEPPSHA